MKDWIKLNKVITVGFMLTVIIFTAKAQNKTNYLDNYTFFGIHSSFNYYSKGVTNYNVNDSPVTIQYDNMPSASFGVIFQVYKAGKFNFQIGFNGRLISEFEKFHIDKNQFNNPVPYYDWQTVTSSDDMIYNIPIRAEYLVSNKLFIYTSIVPGYYEEFGGNGYRRKNDIEITTEIPANNDWFHFNTEIGVGLYIPTKYVLIQPYLYYNKSYRNIWEGSIKIEGIKEREYTEINGEYNQSGNHIGFGLNFYPKKFWKKKS